MRRSRQFSPSVRSAAQERPTLNVSPHTTACTGPSNSALASLITSSREVHGGMWVNSNSPTPAAVAMRPASVPDRCRLGGRSGECVHDASHRNTSASRAKSMMVVAVAGVAAVDERRAGRIGDPHAVGLGRVAHQPGHDVDRADCHGLTVDPVMHVENVRAVVDLAAEWRRRRAEARPGVARAVQQRLPFGRRRMVAAPDEQPRHVEAMIGVQVRQQHVNRTRIGVPLQRAEHASTEVDHQGRRIRCPQQITRCRRIRANDAPGAAQHGNSHGHYCAMPGSTMEKTSPHWVIRIIRIPRKRGCDERVQRR